MIQKHIDLVAKAMKKTKTTHPQSAFGDGAKSKWESVIRHLCYHFGETYPSFNEAEFRKKCGEGEICMSMKDIRLK